LSLASFAAIEKWKNKNALGVEKRRKLYPAKRVSTIPSIVCREKILLGRRRGAV
jgi:hypothetical protein